MHHKIWLSPPHLGQQELTFVQEAIQTNWVAPVGPHINAFEHALEKYLQQNIKVAALNSGTSALHLALIIAGVQAGDEVICQSFTFSASANPIAYLGATPIFVDSEPETWNIAPEFLELAILDRIKKGKKPKAIILVHLYGMPAKLNDLLEISKRYDIPIIEDAAEALGSAYNQRLLGTFGELSILSFNGNKIITTSGGGALLAKQEAYIHQARFLANQAKDPAPHFQHSSIGYNYQMSNICAGIGLGQMAVLPERILQRRSNFEFYKKALAEITPISFTEEPGQEYLSNRWLTTILINYKTTGISPEDVRLHLEKANIESRPVWKPMHLQPVFANAPFYGDGTSQNLFESGLCLPSGSNLTQPDLTRITEELKKCFNQPSL